VKIVLDTNVLIAAFISRGICADLLEHSVRTHELVTSDFILNEFLEKLTGKFKFPLEEAEAAAELLLAKMAIVKPVELPSPVCRDHPPITPYTDCAICCPSSAGSLPAAN